MKKSHTQFLKTIKEFITGFVYYSKSKNLIMKNFAVDNDGEVVSRVTKWYSHKARALIGRKRLTGTTLRWQIHPGEEN